MKRFVILAVMAAAACTSLSGCQTHGSNPSAKSSGPSGPTRERSTQRYEVMAPARAVNAEEAVNFIRAQDELERARNYTSGTEYPHGSNNHPAFVTGGGQAFTSITIRRNETLLSVTNRLMEVANYTRLIYDVSDGAPSPDAVEARMHVDTMGGPTLFGEIVATYIDQFPNLQLFAARDRNGFALVVSDKGYPRWAELAIYDVEPGTVKSNVSRLSASLGWELSDRHGWHTDDFPIPAGYPIVIEPRNPRQALTALLERYPMQAQLNQNTRGVTVIPRPQPNYR